VHSKVPVRGLLFQLGLLVVITAILFCWCCHVLQFPLPTFSRWVCITGFETDNDAGHVVAAGAIPRGVWSQALIQQLRRDRTGRVSSEQTQHCE